MTGVQTCALPIYGGAAVLVGGLTHVEFFLEDIDMFCSNGHEFTELLVDKVGIHAHRVHVHHGRIAVGKKRLIVYN